LLNYVAQSTTGPAPDVTLNDEAEEFRWLPAAEAMALDLNEPTRVLLEHAVSNQLIPA